MTASQGRTWLSGVLMASGLVFVSDARPARACHIHHNHNTESTSSSSSSTSTTPTEGFQQALQRFLTAWHDKTMPTTPATVTAAAVAPTSGMTHPAAEFLAPPTQSAASVPTWHQAQPAACVPPTPPPPCPGGTSTAGSTAPATLTSPSALQNPTPAPEPSTIVSALALAGLLAWRRHRRA